MSWEMWRAGLFVRGEAWSGRTLAVARRRGARGGDRAEDEEWRRPGVEARWRRSKGRRLRRSTALNEEQRRPGAEARWMRGGWGVGDAAGRGGIERLVWAVEVDRRAAAAGPFPHSWTGGGLLTLVFVRGEAGPVAATEANLSGSGE